MSDKQYTISKERYDELLAAEIKLNLLEAGGVDNWEWYGESLFGDHLEKDYHQIVEEL